VTLAEFLQPVRGASKGDQLLATLFYFKYEEGKDGLTTGQLRDALVRARIPRAKDANLSDALGRLIPKVDRYLGDWSLTGTGEEDVRIRLGLDLGQPTKAVQDVTALSRLLPEIDDAVIRDYIHESVTCLQADARRAAVVFLWSGVVAVVREEVWQAAGKKPTEIEKAVQKRNPRISFRKRADFESVNDATLIEITDDFELYGKAQRKRLKEGLDLRNDCGHPTTWKPGENKVSSFIEDMLQVVWAVTPYPPSDSGVTRAETY
jgi:hypothetical protein